MSELVHLSAMVYGHVQGVFFRAFVLHRANSLGLKGYARNLPKSHAVEVNAEGDKQKLEELIEHLKMGPPEAWVEKVEPHWSEFTGQFTNFEIRY